MSVMTWNYYQYNILRVNNEYDYYVVEEFGEDLKGAREQVKTLRELFPDAKYVIQSLHCVARIVR